MKVIKKFNNNVVICVDKNGRELVAMGKGIGFGPVPREIAIEDIERTFYNMEPSEQNIMKDLPSDIVLFTANLMDIITNELPYELSTNAILVMADHICFAIERFKKNINVSMPLLYDVKQMYPLEYKLGQYALKRINREFKIILPDDEIAGIALNLINSRIDNKASVNKKESKIQQEMLNEVTEIIEDEFHIMIDRDTFDYSRYATHVLYLFQRIRSQKSINSANFDIYKDITHKFPLVEQCISKISKYIENKWNVKLSENEKLYLMLHINRICMKEGL